MKPPISLLFLSLTYSLSLVATPKEKLKQLLARYNLSEAKFCNICDNKEPLLKLNEQLLKEIGLEGKHPKTYGEIYNSEKVAEVLADALPLLRQIKQPTS